MENNTQQYNFYKDGLKGNAFFGIANVLTKVFVFVNVIFILKYLTIYEYGVYKLVFSIYVVLGGMLLGSLDGLVLNEVSCFLSNKELEKAKRLLGEFLLVKVCLSVIAFLILFLGSNMVSLRYNQSIGEFIKILSFLYITDSLTSIFLVFYKSKLNFFVPAFMPFFTEFIKFFLIVYLITINGLNIKNLLWLSVISATVVCLILVINALIRYRFSFEKHREIILLNIIKSHGKWALMKSFIINLPSNIRLWIIRIFISTEAVAIFSLIESLYLQVEKIIPKQAFTSIIPRYVRKDNNKELALIYKSSVKYYLILYVFIGVLAFFIGPIFIKIFFSKYIIALPYFKLMLILLLLQGFSLTGMIIYSFRKQKFLFMQPIISIFLVLILNLILVPFFHIWGLVIAYILRDYIVALIYYKYLCRVDNNFRLKLKELFVFDNGDKKLVRQLFFSSKKYLVGKFYFIKTKQ